jgi:hypothetical protein
MDDVAVLVVQVRSTDDDWSPVSGEVDPTADLKLVVDVDAVVGFN